MKTNAKTTGRAVSMPVGITWGTCTAVGMTMILSVVTAWLVHAGVIQQQAIGYCAMGILLMSAIVGAAVAKGKIKRRPVPTAMLTGLCFFLCLMSMTALFFGGQYTGMGVTGLLIFGGSGTAALMGKSGGRRGKKLKFSV